MVSHAFAALLKKRADLAGKEKGFTLIELLVTVIIIGVLAAIAIPVYLNVQDGAKDNAVKSDLTNAKTAVISSRTDGGALPAGLTTAEIPGYSPPSTANYKVALSTDPALSYTKIDADNKFCISGTSKSGKTFVIDATQSAIEGKCTASVAGP